MRVAVTGARGFVGGSLCRLLVGRGWTVFPFDRDTRCEPGHTGGIPIRAFDITAGPLRGAPLVDAVVHVAAYVSDTGPLALARAVNVAGTANVVASFPGARFVHVSSCSVYDPYRPQHNARENEAPDPDQARWTNAYGRTKAEAEVRLRRLRPDAVVLRPHAVYGPGDTTLLPRLRAAGARGWFPLPGSGRQLHSVTHVDNLNRACELGCQPGAAAGTYNINDGAALSLSDLILRVSARRPDELRIVGVPVPVMLALARVSEMVAAARSRASGQVVHPLVSSYSVHHLSLERTFDISAARQHLGFRPAPTSLEGAADW